MKSCNILLIFLLLIINLSAQIVYDTIPDDEIAFGGHWWDELFIMRGLEDQALTYFDKIDFEILDCYGEKVLVSTIFGRNGDLINTGIVKSSGPICDSYRLVAWIIKRKIC